MDPRRRQHAVVVLNRLRAAVDEHFFRPDGEYEVLGGKQTLRHINFEPVHVPIDGEPRDVLVIDVQSKGEKFTGEKERVYAGTERLIAALRSRRDALQGNPDAYVFASLAPLGGFAALAPACAPGRLAIVDGVTKERLG